jgi:poly-gamma-glutamate synthesis protein (capsule biosynthesis protein)
LLHDLSGKTVRQIQAEIQKVKQAGDIVVASIHWGSNWGYEIPFDHRAFAYQLIDEGAVDIVHGHSSHHVRGIEVYHDRLILYGCGDFLNDYEGFSGYEGFRDDLGLMYFVSVEPATGKLISVHMTPTQIKNFKINRASQTDSLWLRDVLNREGKKLGTRVKLNDDNTLFLQWE